MTDPRPHDLLFLRVPEAFTPCGGAAPDWLDAAWLRRAPLVVRRALAVRGRTPVGARGLQRHQRCAGHAALAGVVRCITPESLAAEVLDNAGRIAGAAVDAAALPCLSALRTLAPRLAALGLAWGPAGGTGFWLASGLPVLRPDSDLDLLVRAPAPLPADTLAALCALQQHAACRIDIQVDTGAGGFALNEYARGGRVLLKTANGPLLVDRPWQLREAA